MTQLQCIVVTPEQTVRDMPADFVAVTLFDGEIGILPGHAPMIGRMGYGELRIRNGSEVERYYIEGGFVEAERNLVSLLTNRAIPAAKIDVAAAMKQLDDALHLSAPTRDLMAARNHAVAQGRAQLLVAHRANG